MTDKIQKIREWVKARLDKNASKKSLPQFYGMMEEDARFLDFLDTLQEEPVSEELNEAAWVYYDKNKPLLPQELALHREFVSFFKAGAQWREEQMMAKAVDGVVHHFEKCGLASVHYTDPTGVPMAYYISPAGLSAGDKVKIIVIKED